MDSEKMRRTLRALEFGTQSLKQEIGRGWVSGWWMAGGLTCLLFSTESKESLVLMAASAGAFALGVVYLVSNIRRINREHRAMIADVVKQMGGGNADDSKRAD